MWLSFIFLCLLGLWKGRDGWARGREQLNRGLDPLCCKEGGKEGRRGRKGGREGGKEGGKEGRREGGREGQKRREGRREGVREGGKEGGRGRKDVCGVVRRKLGREDQQLLQLQLEQQQQQQPW